MQSAVWIRVYWGKSNATAGWNNGDRVAGRVSPLVIVPMRSPRKLQVIKSLTRSGLDDGYWSLAECSAILSAIRGCQ